MSPSLLSQNTDPPTTVLFQIGLRSPETGVQMCTDDPLSTSSPPLSLCLFLSALRQKQPCALREQSLADSKLETLKGWL